MMSLHHRLLWLPFVSLGVTALGLHGLCAQTVFSQFVQTPNGPANVLFQSVNGVTTQINTGLVTNDFAALSRDGRFITMTGPDPARPNQTSTDLFIFDRVTGNRRTIVDYSTEALQNGGFATNFARFNALSPNNQLVALMTNILITTNLQGTGTTPTLSVHRVSDGFQISLAEIGQGNALDLFRAEFVGMSWAPDGSRFVTPAYVNTTTAQGLPSASVGIAVFAPNSTTGNWERAGQITTPRVFDNRFPTAIETHIFPSLSPDGTQLSYFEITWPDALLQGAPQVRLMVVNVDGSNPRPLTTFNPGFYPSGTGWSPDGAQVLFSISQQARNGGMFRPAGEPQTAVVRSISLAPQSTPQPIPGISGGFLPAAVPSASPGGAEGTLSGESAIFFTRVSVNEFMLRMPGLDPATTYTMEGSPALTVFDSSQTFTGQQLANGIRVPKTARSRYFRVRQAP